MVSGGVGCEIFNSFFFGVRLREIIGFYYE